uniref:Uncharacterized protein n=1 Tax=Panagrolaimus superbus TaxID=310955 RepID=A0A914XYH8_9BILA
MFHQNFVEDKLNGNAAEFRKEFLKWYCKEKSYSCDKFADDDDEIKKELKETIIKTVSKFGKAFVKKAIHAFDFDKFAKELFLLVNGAVDITSIKCNRKKIGKQSDGMNENLINLLAGYVFVYAENEKCAKFRTSFSSNKFKEDLNNLISNENVDKEETILNLIKFKKAFENQFTVNFNLKDKIQFKGIEKCRFNVNDYESSYEKEPEQKLPLNEEIKDEEIYEFFDKFVFAVNQPNEIRLGEIIAESLKKNLNLSDPKLYADHLIMKAIDWAKDKNGGYLDGINIDEFIAEIHQQKSNLALSSRSSTNRNRFKKYGNNHEISDLSSFLLKNKKNVLWLSAVNPLSIATMVDSTLKKMNSKFKYDDEVIIITLSDLENMPEDVSSAFKYGKADLMIIIAEPDNCDDIDDEVIMDVGNALSKIIAEKKEKKIVIISNENNVLPNCFKKNVQKVTAAFNSYNTTNSTKCFKSNP